MKKTLLHEIIIAAVFALLSPAAGMLLRVVLPGFLAMRLLIVLIALAYVVMLLGDAGRVAGRISAFALASLCLAGALLYGASAGEIACLAVIVVWLARAVTHYRGIVPGLMDLVLCGASCSAAISVWTSGGGFRATVWTFFLLQALHVFIPTKIVQQSPGAYLCESADRFLQAKRSAEAALERMS